MTTPPTGQPPLFPGQPITPTPFAATPMETLLPQVIQALQARGVPADQIATLKTTAANGTRSEALALFRAYLPVNITA